MHEKPNVMQFNEIRDKYEKIMLTQLKSEKALLLIESQTTSLDTSDITHWSTTSMSLLPSDNSTTDIHVGIKSGHSSTDFNDEYVAVKIGWLSRIVYWSKLIVV